MKINQKIAMLKEEIKEKEYELRTIKEKAVLFSAPKGYSKGTSYEIHDCIHGSKKSVDIYKLAEEIERLETLIEIDKHILKQLEKEKDIEKKVNEIESVDDKIAFLRKLGLTVEEIASTIWMSERQIYRHLRKMKEMED
jgi:DNA-binding transcriptional ArsR family regulator